MKTLPNYFNAVEEPALLPMFQTYGQTVKAALVFRCYGFKGQMPQEPEKY
jgi:hypothetical protein